MSLIDPGKIPLGMEPEMVRVAALTYSISAGQIRDGGAGVLLAWQKLPSSLEATGTAHIYGVMDLVGSNTQIAGDGLDGVAKALNAYADDLDKILARFTSAFAEASAFVAQANSFGTKVESVSSGYTLGISVPEIITSWDQDPTMNDKNNALIHEVARIEADWYDAQERCATAVRAAAGLGPTFVKQEKAAAKALRSSGDLKTDWGTTSNRKESCTEKAVTFQTHFDWDGLVVGVGGGLLKSVGALTGTWDGKNFLPFTAADDLLHGRWKAYWSNSAHALATAGGAWLGLTHLISGSVRPKGLDYQTVEMLIAAGALNFLPKGVRNGIRDWNREDGTAVTAFGSSFWGLNPPSKWWDTSTYKPGKIFSNWTDNPGGTTGLVAGNIATFFLPGGAEGSAAKAGVEGAEGAADAARLARGADASTSALATLRALDRDALGSTFSHLPKPTVDDLFHALKQDEPDLSGFNLELPKDPTPDVQAPAEHEPAVPSSHDPVAPASHEPTVPSAHDPVAPASHEPATTSTPVAHDPGAPAAHDPAPDAPAAHDPASGTPDAPVAHDPVPDAPAAHDPASDAPAAHDPASDAPAAHDPGSDAPAAHDPASDAPAAHDPAPDAPAAHDPGADVPANHDTPPTHDGRTGDDQPTPFTPRPHEVGSHTRELEPNGEHYDPQETRPTRLGRIGEELTRKDLEDRKFTIVAEQPQIMIPGGGGRWFKPDFLAIDPSGHLVLIESKMGARAGFSAKQLEGYAQFDRGGLEFEGRTGNVNEALGTRLRNLGYNGRTIDRVEVYRWNVDYVPDAESGALARLVR